MNTQHTEEEWVFANASFNPRAGRLHVDGDPVDLESKPTQVLAFLVERAGEVVTKDELLNAVWEGRVVGESVLSVAMSKLRAALQDHDRSIVRTVHGYGYRLDREVFRQAAEPLPAAELKLKPGDALRGRPNWTLDHRIGLGSHGEVWLARHGKTQEQRVIKYALSPRHLRGLKREVTASRLLAQMRPESKCFVRIRDWSFDTPPFFVESDYSGVSLAELWRSGELGQLDTPQRLQFFSKLCDAVATAHAIGIIHHDLKPSNILVDRSKADDWQPVVADFGSSQLKDDAVALKAQVTALGFTEAGAASGSRTGPATLMYAAPERLQGQPSTIRSDLYSLGVILFQLLIDNLERPLGPGWEADIQEPLLRNDIRDAAHGNPDQRIASADDLARRIRSLEQRRLDLQAEAAQTKRTADAEAALRRTRARRPWVAATLAAAIFGMAVSLYFYAGERHALEQTRAQAEIAAATTNFLNSALFAPADPRQGGTADIPLRDALDAATQDIGNHYADQPALEQSLRQTIAQLYLRIGAHEKSAEQYRTARQLLLAQDNPDADQRQLLTVRLARALAMQGELKAAAAELETVPSAQALDVNNPDLAMQVRLTNARRLFLGTEWDTLDPLLDELLSRTTDMNISDTDGPRREAVIVAINAYANTGRSAAGVELARAWIEELVAADRGDSYDAIIARALLGRNLEAEGEFDQAAEIIAKCIEGMTARQGPIHTDTLAMQQVLASIELQRDAPDRALALYQTVVDGYRQELGDLHPYTLQAIGGLGAARNDLGRSQAAIDGMLPAYQAGWAEHGFEHLPVMVLGRNIAEAALDNGNLQLAENTLDEIAPGTASMPDSSLWPGFMAFLRGRLMEARGQPQAARQLFQQAGQVLSGHLPAGDRRRKVLEKHGYWE